jgi:hypothetical protein
MESMGEATQAFDKDGDVNVHQALELNSHGSQVGQDSSLMDGKEMLQGILLRNKSSKE